MCFAAGKSSGSTLNTSGALAWALPTGLALCSCLVACQSDCGRTRRLMNRRDFISLLGGAAVAWPLAAEAQLTERVRRIGLLMVHVESDQEGQTLAAAFREGLLKSGWTEGRNIRIDTRWAGGDLGRARSLATELVALA